MRTIPRLAIVGGTLALAACGGGGGGGTLNPPGTRLGIEADDAAPSPGQVVVFTVTGSTSQGTITDARIDFDGDGTWDETQPQSGSAISTTFSHAYPSAGSYTVRAEILQNAEVLAAQTVQITVKAKIRNVLLVAWAPRIGPRGACMADGEPIAEGPGLAVNLPEAAGGVDWDSSTWALGSYAVGTVIDVTQAFSQYATVWDPREGEAREYGCNFQLYLYTATPRVKFANGTCTTDSYGSELACSVTLHATVP